MEIRKGDSLKYEMTIEKRGTELVWANAQPAWKRIFSQFSISHRLHASKTLDVEWKLNKFENILFTFERRNVPIPWAGFHTDCFLTFRNVVFTNHYVTWMIEQMLTQFMHIFFQWCSRLSINMLLLFIFCYKHINFGVNLHSQLYCSCFATSTETFL